MTLNGAALISLDSCRWLKELLALLAFVAKKLAIALANQRYINYEKLTRTRADVSSYVASRNHSTRRNDKHPKPKEFING